jgi:FkbM family methyltransferase
VQTYTAQWAGLTFQHRNQPEFELVAREIFEGGEYGFACHRSDPVILDCGSHIGLSVAWFKQRFPRARIVAFEPDPESFRLLQANVAANGFEGVELLNVAVSFRQGTARFYGQFDVAEPMASAHSLRKDWGTQRSDRWIEVQTVRLADYISGPVDYLKLDIEGMENEVLPSIESRLHLVGAMGLEFHGTGPDAEADEARVLAVLERSGFRTSVARKTRAIFPPEIDAWVERVHPRIAVIKATRG